jgi:hypothetical protein
MFQLQFDASSKIMPISSSPPMKRVLSSASLKIFLLNTNVAHHVYKIHQSRHRLFIRESAILPFELTLLVSHLTDADGTPILQAGLFDQGECAGCAKPLIPNIPVHLCES